MLAIFSWLAVLLLLAASLTLLLTRSGRWQALGLAAQYLAASVLTLNHWPVNLSAALLVTGWMAAAVLAASYPTEAANRADEGWPFHLFLAGFVLVSALGAALSLNAWLSTAGLPLLVGALILIGAGLLQLGLSSQPGRTTLGLLMTLAGFETLFSALENSVLVAALLSAVTLTLALVGVYFLQAPTEAA